MINNKMSESDELMERTNTTRIILEKFERSKILEVYFSRLDGRTPDAIPSDYHELYTVELNDIKSFLLGQHPHDSLLQRIFRMMN